MGDKNGDNDHERQTVLIFKQLLQSSTKRNLLKPVRRICRLTSQLFTNKHLGHRLGMRKAASDQSLHKM